MCGFLPSRLLVSTDTWRPFGVLLLEEDSIETIHEEDNFKRDAASSVDSIDTSVVRYFRPKKGVSFLSFGSVKYFGFATRISMDTNCRWVNTLQKIGMVKPIVPVAAVVNSY